MILFALLLATDVAVTVDDLPRHGAIPEGTTRVEMARALLDAFQRHKLPPVYGFVNGGKLAAEPELKEVIDLWRAAGNPIGNHGYSHLPLNDTPVVDYVRDIAVNEGVLRRFGPPEMWRFYRFPYLQEGETLEKRRAVRAWLIAHRYRTAQVTIDFDDWAFNAPYVRCLGVPDAKTAADLRQRYLGAAVDMLEVYRGLAVKLAGREIKHVLLLHVGALGADRIEALLTAYEKAGVRWIDLPTALADPFYATDPNVVWKAGATLLDQVARAREVHYDAPWNKIDEDALGKLCR